MILSVETNITSMFLKWTGMFFLKICVLAQVLNIKDGSRGQREKKAKVAKV